ncbi:arsenical pump-driving ATPase GET3 [Nostoc sp. CHAB 5836]|uniref:arsenical pump-driving ATPase GET3 n=1 Tax=Nostoc sp. CHAB 5836 TaxID=2780404 RepID=UPI001E40AE57|nr:arsenical pump-driving ATPase GET3 [Nostoc sp. CHAB 5836]MCC5619422.1 arsenical pump-driving ATPase GET3 [Nostoc sp. CHAB 5836]
MKYDRSKFRELIKALTAQELDESLDHFRAVREQFTDGQQTFLREKIILDHFEKHQEEIESLLEAIKKCNLTAYNNYVNNFNSSENQNTLSLSWLKLENSDSKLIDELTDIFSQQDHSFVQCAKQVYQDFLLQQNEPDFESKSDNLSEHLLSKLEDWPDKTIILEFVPRLVAYLFTKDSNKYRESVKKLRQIINKDIPGFKDIRDDFRENIRQFKQDYNKSSAFYLIIEIKEIKSYNNLFQISGWLATDEIIKNPELDFIPLSNQNSALNFEDNQAVENLYNLEQVKEIVQDYRLQINSNRETEKLIVEFFLPSSLLCWDVEQWEVDTQNQIQIQIFWKSLCEVRIRSSDRLNLQYRDCNKLWKKKWEFVKKCVHPLGKFLNGDFNGDVDLIGLLKNEEIVGLKMNSALESGHEQIASALYYSGTPIALWFRSEPPEGDCEMQLNRLLQDKLLKLSERVFQERHQPKRHISLIWDDPNRLIPTYQLK